MRNNANVLTLVCRISRGRPNNCFIFICICGLVHPYIRVEKKEKDRRKRGENEMQDRGEIWKGEEDEQESGERKRIMNKAFNYIFSSVLLCAAKHNPLSAGFVKLSGFSSCPLFHSLTRPKQEQRWMWGGDSYNLARTCLFTTPIIVVTHFACFRPFQRFRFEVGGTSKAVEWKGGDERRRTSLECKQRLRVEERVSVISIKNSIKWLISTK